MSPRARLLLFLVALAIVVPGLLHVARRMPTFGAHPLPYGDAVNARGTPERHVTNMVSAINFDYRGFDTLGEEFMLLAAVTGTAVLLRGTRGEHVSDRPGIADARPIAPRSDAMVLATRLFAIPVLVFGVYVALHATVTPGGGFQGGVIVASGFVLVFLGEGYAGWRRLISSAVLDATEAGGAALFALCGFAAMFAGLPFLTNILPLGTPKDVWSGGLMLVENAGVALAVAGSFGIAALEFLEETRAADVGERRR